MRAFLGAQCATFAAPVVQAPALIADTATDAAYLLCRITTSFLRCHTAFGIVAPASRRATSGNNDRLSTQWREEISLASVARSFSKKWSNQFHDQASRWRCSGCGRRDQNDHGGREKAPRGTARHAEQFRLQCDQGYFGRPHCASGRRVCALCQDQELPLARIRSAFPGLSPSS